MVALRGDGALGINRDSMELKEITSSCLGQSKTKILANTTGSDIVVPQTKHIKHASEE